MKNIIVILISFLGFSLAAQPCLPDGIEFNTQVQIDSFQIHYPNCTEIEGDVTIYGQEISDLYGLSNIIHFRKSLRINNTILDDLAGLDNVVYIGGDLHIGYWDHVGNNLKSLTGLNNLDSIGGNLWFISNEELPSLAGLDSLKSIGGNLEIKWNEKLTSLTGLDYLDTITGHVQIGHNLKLSDLSGLANLTFIDGEFSIMFTYVLQDLSGLNNLTAINGDFTITENDSLFNLTGLNSLNSINGTLRIYWNEVLNSISELSSLNSIEGGLDIFNNDNLASLSGLDSVDSYTIDSLKIRHNDLLTHCEVVSICDYLANPIGSVEIHDNATGCNNPEEVEESCIVGITTNGLNKSVVKFYPNPAAKVLNISFSNDISIKELNIYNQIGHKVISELRPHKKINVSSLNSGLYIVELITDDNKITKKLIIK